MEKLLNHLNSLEQETVKALDEIPEPFERLEDSENYNYYSGCLEVIHNVKDFISKEIQQ